MVDTPTTNGGNGRVTRAKWEVRIEEKIDRLLECYQIGALDRKELHAEDDELETRMQKVETDVARIQERQGMWAGLLAAFSAIAAAISGVLGHILNK